MGLQKKACGTGVGGTLANRIGPPGISLRDALQHFATDQEWERYCQTEAYRLLFMILEEPESPYMRKHNEYHALHRKLSAVLLDRLRTGELKATGFVRPLAPGARRTAICADTWEFLEVNFDESTAEGHGLGLVGIKVFEPTPIPGLEIDPVQVIGTPPDWQPSASEMKVLIWREIENEMRKRAAAGKLTGSIVQDCRHISAAVRRLYEHHPHARVPGGRRIEEKLRELYRRLTKDGAA